MLSLRGPSIFDGSETQAKPAGSDAAPLLTFGNSLFLQKAPSEGDDILRATQLALKFRLQGKSIDCPQLRQTGYWPLHQRNQSSKYIQSLSDQMARVCDAIFRTQI